MKNSDFKKGEDVNSAKWYHSLFFLVENSLIIGSTGRESKKNIKNIIIIMAHYTRGAGQCITETV